MEKSPERCLGEAEEGEEPQSREVPSPQHPGEAEGHRANFGTWHVKDNLHHCCGEAIGHEETGNQRLVMSGEASAEVGQ